MSVEVLETQVLEWADGKGILFKGNENNQLTKFNEEAEEFTEAVDDGDLEAIQSEAGDVLVTLIIQLNLQGFSLEEALQCAYDKISKRKGKLVNGVFVKEGS